MPSTTASKTISILRELFARFRIPQQLVLDNGPQFISEEFKQFMSANGVKHIKSSPYHPASNGAAERMVQTLKLALKADHKKGVPLDKALANFLLQYRITPHTTTGVSPCNLMMNRGLRTRLDLLKPDIATKVHCKQADQKQYSDRTRRPREFSVDDAVMARNFREGDKWMMGKIVDKLGPVSYLVQCEDGSMWRCHVDHIQDISVSPEPTNAETPINSNSPVLDDTSSDAFLYDSATDTPRTVQCDAASSDSITEQNVTESNVETSTVPPTSRYPHRITKPPDRYM